MSRDMNKRYKVTLYPLTSIFIGSGAKIETQEYVIKNGYMYKFNIIIIPYLVILSIFIPFVLCKGHK